ncbi:hypothetical protein HYPBUDRAFT_199691 [Hyphopichia burtonii NRRL Y-1933]|uniref:Uncharacterized protein n=1 Tax=Hyphopichia burtonii NRRL Y-1933 TaxID=984485 RepID=A0A1E4RKT3_9ASCO|nr:hypothetical protein HYPBUDRAFT_199691 [Hyphopichia burtonii NRRL Y-1933]ODV67863.1 hypothetical protein HYPBUDRAFT_199691 [Hyphopichia burtonii NRRL Y-1933]
MAFFLLFPEIWRRGGAFSFFFLFFFLFFFGFGGVLGANCGKYQLASICARTSRPTVLARAKALAGAKAVGQLRQASKLGGGPFGE